ncbi:GNAT family N-acetyltransferase [Nonomuraea wenchangensis]
MPAWPRRARPRTDGASGRPTRCTSTPQAWAQARASASALASAEQCCVFYDHELMSQSPTLSATKVTSERLLLRKAHHTDRDGLIELMTDPEVQTYLGGPRPRSEVEQFFDTSIANSTLRPGNFVIADNTTKRLSAH